ncbi:ATP-binding protein, partial [Streptomyces sp. NPDC002265]
MRVLLVGAGGVGTAITRIAARRSFFEAMVVADHDPARSEAGRPALGPDRTWLRGQRRHPDEDDGVVGRLRRLARDV